MSHLVPTRLFCAWALLVAGSLVLPAARAQEPAPAPLPALAPADDEDQPGKLGPWTWESTPAHLRIGSALREARRASPTDSPLLQQRIIESGRDAVAAQIDILLRSRVPEAGPKDGPQVLSEVQRDLLLGAIAKMPLNAVRTELDARLSKTPDDRTARLGAMHALAVVGAATDLERLVALAPRRPGSDDLALPYASREALRRATAGILGRVPASWTAMSSLLRSADTAAAKVLLEALGGAREPRALALIFDTARTNHKLKWKAVSLVPVCGSSLSAETDRQFLEWVRSEFQTAEPNHARALLMAVGALDDGAWVPTLIDRLEDEDTGLRAEALAALRRISGLGYPGDPSLWRTWYDAESRWHTQRRPQLLALLSSAETPKVISAIREYSEHRTRRAELADELLRVLEHGKPEVRSLVIGVLEHLGSPAACTALVGMTRDSDAKVCEAAWRALRAISGVELSRDPEQLHSLFDRS
jgi:HEAT repeat protein